MKRSTIRFEINSAATNDDSSIIMVDEQQSSHGEPVVNKEKDKL